MTQFRAFDTSIAISPDGRRIGLAHYTSGWAVYNAQAGALFSGSYAPETFEYKPTIALSNAYVAVVHNPDGRLLAGVGGGSLRVWDVASGALLFQAAVSDGTVLFSPDGTYLVTGDWQCYICGSDESAQLSAARLWAIPAA